MKKLLLFGLIVSLSFNLLSQPWKSNLSKSKTEYTFFDYQKAFNDYWGPKKVINGWYTDSKGIKRKAPGWKQFKRWEWYWEPRVDRKTGEFPKTSAFEIWQKYSANKSTKSVGGTWTSVGDHTLDAVTDPGALQESGTGRINCAAFDPDNDNHIWVGAPSGGLWVTTNGGTSWTCLTDNNPILGVSDIALSPNYATDHTIYIATGDRDAGDDPSIGILKSTDDGVTWEKTGLKLSASNGAQVVRVIIDPNDANTIYAATSIGFYKSTDAGVSFTFKQSGNFIDMEMIPGSESGTGGADLIATTNTSNAEAWRSTDAGENWTATFTASNSEEDRCDVAVTPANSDYVYIITAWNGGAIGSIYRSTNGGASFTEVYDGATENNLFGWDENNSRADGGQGFYDVTLAVSNTNANVVYVGGVNAYISSNGASSFSLCNIWDPGYGSADCVHADHHNAYFRPSDNRLFDCNDGGFYYSDNPTSAGSSSWIDITDGLITGQLYDIGVSQTENGSVLGGYQDNGGKYRDISTSSTDWEQVREGDGCCCAIDPTNVNNQWMTYPTGYVFRTTTEWASGYTNLRTTNDAAWSFPVEADPISAGTVYVGAQAVERYVGTTRTILGSLGAYLLTMDVYNDGSNLVIWTGSSSDLWKSNTSGGSYTSVYSGLPGNSVMDIAIDDDDYNHVYVSLGGYDYNVVYETTNGGSTWTDISSGLPPVPAGAIVINEQNTAEHEIYVGTDAGIFVKVGDEGWRLFNSGMPVVSITDLEIFYDATPENSKLYAGTYGRDTWVSDMYTVPTGPMTYVSSTVTQNNLFDVFQATVKNEIICIEVVTNGSTSPLDLTSFTFNTNGSTDAANDISNAKVYYTNCSNVFSTSNQFGSTAANPSGSFTVTGTQTLEPGTNYFWLTYDIEASATLNNYVDAECTSLTVGTPRTPDITNPAGSRQITVGSYCDSYSGNLIDPNSYGISHVIFSGIDNQVDPSDGHYNDYTSLSASVTAGSSYPLTVTLSTGSNTFYATAWIDWNHDFDFDDPGEVFNLGANSVDDGDVSTTVDVPVDALGGDTRMRVVSTFDNPPVNCGEYRYGETEDYTVNVTPATPMVYISSSTAQTNTGNVLVGATDAEIISVEIVTSGALDPLDATSFTFSTNGSTNASGDITNARLYYTGTSSSFTTSNLFATQTSPDGIFTLTGSQTLSSGTNYFWLVYDINSLATGGNIVDAECNSISVGSSYTPTPEAPSGSRTIITDPCLITTFPYTQDFDLFTAHTGSISGCQSSEFSEFECWENDKTNDDIDWIPRSGSTTSNNTGPTDDHGVGGIYLYIEASTCNNNTAYLYSPRFDFSNMSSANLSFWYHMDGSDMGTLSVHASTDGGNNWSSVLWNESADLGTQWQESGSIDLTSFVGNSSVILRFTGLTGSNFRSDMAIDDITVDGTLITYTSWNGSTNNDWQTTSNWTPAQVPSSSDDVVIPDVSPNAFPVIDDGSTVAECNNLTVESGANITIAVNGDMTVSGTITNNAGISGLIINSDASGTGSLIHGSATNVNATVNCFLQASPEAWHLISPPIITAPLIQLPTTNNLYFYDELKDDFWLGNTYGSGSESGWSDPIDNLISSTGYFYYYYQATLQFQGGLNTNAEAGSINIDYTEHPGTASNGVLYTDLDGWNLIGNPFTSAIDWTQVDAGAANLNNAIYTYDGTNYASWVGGVSTNGGSEFIPAGQGFFVKGNNSAGGTLTIPASAKVHSDQAFWKRNNKNLPNDYLKLAIQVGDYTDETVIRVSEFATNLPDGNFDAYKRFSMNDNVPQVYTVDNNQTQYSINTISDFEDQISVPLRIYNKADAYTLKLKEFNFDDINVYFRDNLKGITQQIVLNDEIYLNKDNNDNTGRYSILFEKKGSNISDIQISNIMIYPNPNNGSFYLTVDTEDKYWVEIINITGKSVYENSFENKYSNLISLNDQTAGIYIVKIKFEDNTVINKKIVLK